MGIKQLYNDNLRKLPNEYGDVSVMSFSEFEPRQRLGHSQMIFDNLLSYILSISMRIQNFIKIFQTV